MRLYDAICAWLEATAFEKLAMAGSAGEPQPQGDTFANVEHAHSFTTEPELHAGWRPSEIGWEEDRGRISLRWRPKA